MLKTRSHYSYHFFIYCILLPLILSACAQPAAALLPIPETRSGQQAILEPATISPEAGQVSTTTTETAALETHRITPTPEPPAADRLKPEDWQNWPVVPEVSARARQIYQSGLERGINPASFSKVGDCQAIKDVLLGRYDKAGTYTLRENTQSLEETIQYFKGSFDRDGEAVQGGFNAASVLTPLMSNPDICEPGETPLECEIRVHNPSILLISLEVWWDGRSPSVYEKNMRQIIEYAIGKGILPVLSTKADNVEGDHSINLATARLAYEYDLPLWNWWKAAQALPNHGLDPDRPDGFHISQEFAWPERSFTALQVLDAVWRGVRIAEPTKGGSPDPMPTGTQLSEQSHVCPAQPGADNPCATSETTAQTSKDMLSTARPDEIVSLATIDPLLLNNPSGFILLSTARRSGEMITPLGIFLIDPGNGNPLQIAPQGMELQAVSPDGRRILLSQGSVLHMAALDGSPSIELSDHFLDRGASSAIWLPDGKTVAFLAEQDGTGMLMLYTLDGSAGWRRLSPADKQPVAIYPSLETGGVFWEDGSCQASGVCTRSGVFFSGLDGSSVEYLPDVQRIGFSADKRWLAYEGQADDETSRIYLATIDLKTRRLLENIGSHLLDFSWSPDGTKLSLLTLERSDYSGKWLDVRNLVITPLDMGTKILPETSGMNPRAVWSPDNSELLLTGTQQTETGYVLQMRIMNATTGTVRDISDQVGIFDRDFIYTGRINWVKFMP